MSDANLITDLAKKTSKTFAGINVTVFIVFSAFGGIVGMCTPILGQFIAAKGLASKVEGLKGRVIQAEENVKTFTTVTNSQAVEIADLKKERHETDLLIQKLTLALENKDNKIKEQDNEIAALQEKNRSLTLRIEELESKIKQS